MNISTAVAIVLAVLFVDLVGSTQLASTRPASEVVSLLNEFFRVIVDTVNRHGGFVNKFQGDAALAIFGAPIEHPDASGAALAASAVTSPPASNDASRWGGRNWVAREARGASMMPPVSHLFFSAAVCAGLVTPGSPESGGLRYSFPPTFSRL